MGAQGRFHLTWAIEDFLGEAAAQMEKELVAKARRPER